MPETRDLTMKDTRSLDVYRPPEERRGPAEDVFVFPTSAAQRGFWYLDKLAPGNPAFNIAIRVSWRGALRLKTLERAFNEVVSRHEALRTVFADEGDGPVQVVRPSPWLRVPIVDIRDSAEGDPVARREELALAEARYRFDLAKGPLIRLRVLRLDDRDHVLLVTVHHIVSDGWSVGLIIREMAILYGAIHRGGDSPLPALELQYADYAVWQQEWLEGGGATVQIGYWVRRLAGASATEVPPDRPRPDAGHSTGRIESILLPSERIVALSAVADREKTTLFTAALAALAVVLRDASGRDEVVVGTTTAGRTRLELEPVVGPFINMLAIRVDFLGATTFPELLTRVREAVVEALANQDAPFEWVVEALRARRDPARHPLFKVNFIFQRAYVEPHSVPDATLIPVPSLSPGAMYDLNFVMVKRDEGWRFSCEYNTELYEPATVGRLITAYQSLLDGIAADPSRPLSRILTSDATVLSVRDAARAPEPASREEPAGSAYVPPRDATEARLVEIWERVLNVKRLSVTADFFDEGGHSLLAAKLFAQIESAFGRRLLLATLVRSPTVRAIADRLRKESLEVRSEQVHVIQPGRSKVPFFVVTSQPPLYRPLARRLGPDQPVIGLTAPELAALPPEFDARSLAANLVEALCEARPHGPYYLGGWCVSGVVVYEMAAQLRQRGEEVALLALFDTQCPPYTRRIRKLKKTHPARLYFLGERLMYRVGKLRRSRAGETREYLRKRAREAWDRVRTGLRRLGLYRPAEPPLDDIARLSILVERAATSYDPEPCSTPVVLFRSKILQTGRFRDPELGWREFARGVFDVYEIPGVHGDMFREPLAERLAEVLSRYLP